MKKFRTKKSLIVLVAALFFGFANVSFATPPPSFTCGSSTVQDADGNTYGTTNVNGQCWMTENLRVGTMVSGATTQTNNGVMEKYCYGDNPANCLTDGGLYQWDEAMQYSTTEGAGGMCPAGWHIPTDAEFFNLENYLKDPGASCDANRADSVGFMPMWGCNGAGTKMKLGIPYGLNFPLAGYRTPGGYSTPSATSAFIWSSSQRDSLPWYRSLISVFASVGRDLSSKKDALTVRCLQNSPVAPSSSGIVFFGNDNTARDCSAIGTWDTSTKTCTMNRDVAGRVIIPDAGTTLDGNGHTLSEGSSDTAYGVRVQDAGSATVKNLHINGFSFGIYFDTSPFGTAKNNTVNNQWIGISFFSSSNGTVQGNTIIGTTGFLGLSVNSSDTAQIENNTVSGYSKNIIFDRASFGITRGNTISGGRTGIEVRNGSDNTFEQNTISGASDADVYFSDGGSLNSFRNIFSKNTFRNSNVGVLSTLATNTGGGGGPSVSFLSVLFPQALALSDNDNVFFRNDFLNNTRDVSLASADLFRFSKLAPDGGNFWDKNTDCVDTNTDGFCDTPYLVSSFGVSDDLPRMHPMNWGQPPLVITLTNPIETEDDGVQDTKGVADKTNFTFDILYTGEAAPSDVTLWTNDGTTAHYPLAISATTTNDGNFANGESYTLTKTFPKGHYSYHLEANGGALRYPATGELSFTTGYDSIVFLHGIAGSRLYEVSEFDSQRCATDVGSSYFKRWLPQTNCDNTKILLNTDGTSRNDIVTKEVIDVAVGTTNIYQSFLNDLNTWKNTDHIIADYSVIPYDWRLSLDDLFTKGKKSAYGYIDYSTALSSGENPYIMSEFMRTASSSDTGKVTIVAHSTGGLLTKELMRRLRTNGKENLADKIIFVAVPEIGTPDAFVAVLHGSNMGPLGGIISDSAQTREMSQNMATAYNLLPSSAYYNTTISHTVPIASFDTSGLYANQRNAYGGVVGNYDELAQYVLGFEGREKPSYADTNSPEIGNNRLLTQAGLAHANLDVWTPASTTKVIEVAGWGIDTLAGLEYGSETYCVRTHFSIFGKACDEYGLKKKLFPVTTVSGDETVVSDSAHYLSDNGTANTELWWVNLFGYNEQETPRAHKNILEVNPLRQFIRNQITNTSKNLEFISQTKPTDTRPVIKYTLHSPLTLNLYDDLGNHTGISTTTGATEENIPGAFYREIGDTKYIIAPADTAGHLVLNGYAEGSFSLDVQKMNGDTITASTTFSAIPSSTSTVATLNVSANSDLSQSSLSPLAIDFNGDGAIDASMVSKPNQETVYDVTPPDAILSFDTEKKTLRIIGNDAVSSTTVATSSTYAKITDEAGNTTELFFSKFKVKPKKIDLIISTIKQNGILISNVPIPLSYKWNASGKLFASYIKTETAVTETHYRSKKNLTIVMTKPIELYDDDSDDLDTRPTKEKLPGVHLVELKVESGTLNVRY